MGKKIILSSALAALLIWAAAGSADTPPKCPDCAHIARRAAERYSAAIYGDWPKLYGTILPSTRKKLAIGEYVANPHFLPPDFSKRAPLPRGAAPAFDVNRKYTPLIMGYKFIGFRMDRRRSASALLAELTVPQPPSGGDAVMTYQVAEFWKKAGGEWYFDFERTYRPPSAVSVEGEMPVVVLADDLSLALAEKALAAQGEERAFLLDQALWVNPLGITKYLADKNISGGGLPIVHVRRSLQAVRQYPQYYSLALAQGYWSAIVGDWASAYGGYSRASSISPMGVRPRAGAVIASAHNGDWKTAAEEYRLLLETVSGTGENPPPTLEKELEGDCPLCARVGATSALAIAERLIELDKTGHALSIWRWVVENDPIAKKGLERLLAGKEAPLNELAPPGLVSAATALSLAEVERLLSAAGYAFAHPGDLPREFAPFGDVVLQNLPPVKKEEFEPDYNVSNLPPSAKIVWNGATVERAGAHGRGWLFAAMRDGKVNGDFYADEKKGANTRFAEAVASLPKGTPAIAARVAGFVPPSPGALSPLAGLGVDEKKLAENINIHAVAGIKGATPGSAVLFAPARPLRKTLAAPKEAPQKPSRPTLVYSRTRDGVTLRLLRP